jgi:hypothetical protein
MKSYLIAGLALLFFVGAGAAMAAGGKHKWNNPIFADGCVATLPAGIDLDECDEAEASPTGLKTYFCEGEIITVECPDDGDNAPRGREDDD